MTVNCETPLGCFSLKRIPDTDKNLQAWNSADLHILNQVYEWEQEGKLKSGQSKVLILNDAFGVLTVAMSNYHCDSYSDSYISHEATRMNLKANCPDNINNIQFIKSTDNLSETYDLVLFKETKSQSFFKEEVQLISSVVKPKTMILGGLMAKNLQKKTLHILQEAIGPAHASLTWKKSRLLFVEKKVADRSEQKIHEHVKKVTAFLLDDTKESIKNLSNVFSKNKLDIGTRFFLQHFPKNIPESKSFKNIIDLGCGNGVLSLKAAKQFPDANISCVDESYMAVESAKMTLEGNIEVKNRKIRYLAANGLSVYEPDSADLILCNPPFHQQYVVGDAIAWQMFKDSKKALVRGGELWIVGNRHLAYHVKLKKIFGNQKIIATNNKFVVLKAVKT